MQFKHPEVLYALFALIIPVIVHLFQLRRFKRVDFSNVAFLKKVKLETRKSAVLKKWLVMLTRMGALAALIVAFAQPFKATSEALSTKRKTILYIDNSFSMQGHGAEGQLFERAIQEVIRHIPEKEEFTLFTNDKVFKNTTVQNSKNAILGLDYCSRQMNYNAVWLKAKQLAKESATDSRVVLLSDFQQKKESLAFPGIDSTIQLSLVKFRPILKKNIAVDSVFLKKNSVSNWSLHVNVSNFSNDDLNIPIAIYNKDNLLGKKSVPVKPNVQQETSFELESMDAIAGSVKIKDPALPFDNTLFFSINPPPKIKAMVIGEENASYLKALMDDQEFELSIVAEKDLDYNKFQSTHFLFINELTSVSSVLVNAIKGFIDAGGILCFVPAKDGDILSYQQLVNAIGQATFETYQKQTKKITSINFSHPLFSGVFSEKVTNFQYPVVQSYLRSNSQDKVLSFENGDAFLFKTGTSYFFTASLTSENSDFKKSPLIVPTIYNIAKQSMQSPALYYTIDQVNSFEVSAKLGQDEIISLAKGSERVIPLQQTFNEKVRLTTHRSPNKAGHYSLMNGEENLQAVSYNYDRSESVLAYHDLSELTSGTVYESVQSLFDAIKANRSIHEFWKWFVIFALVFIGIEILLLKFLK